MTRSPRPVPRASLEGLLGGAAAGAWMAALERSPTFSIFADVLNASYRVLGRVLSEETLTRLDTEGVTLAAYVGGSALLGAAIGALLALSTRRPGATRRALLLALALAAADAAAFGAVWLHRDLSLPVGGAIVAAGALFAAIVSRATGALAGALLPRRTLGPVAALAVLAVALTCGAVLVSARADRPGPPGPLVQNRTRLDPGLKVALIGIDGLDWPIVEAGIEQGRLPNLARLVASGTRGDLRSLRPPKSPVVWTSMATGMLPSVHGIRDFVVRREGRRIPVTGNLRRVPALWNLARDCGFRVAFTNWYVTWPAEEVAGVMISDRVDFEGLDRRVFPEELTAAVDSVRASIDERADRDISRFARMEDGFAGWRAGQWGQLRRALRILDDVVRHDLVTLECARVALRGGQPDLTALYFRGNDNTQHLFWKYRFAQMTSGRLAGLIYDNLDPREVGILAEVVDRYYDFADELLGHALDLLQPGTAVLVLSDHGFLTNNERGRWYGANRLLEAAGLTALEPGTGGLARPGESAVLDPEPPTTTPQRTLRAGGKAGKAGDALARAREILAAARTDSGKPLFLRLEPGVDEEGPYLTVVFDPDLEGESAIVAGRVVPFAEFLVPEGHSGNHRMNGLLLAQGPPFRPGSTVKGARAVDVAPTVLYLLGAPVARDMEGVVVEKLIDPEWMAEHPVRYVASYGRREGAGAREAISTEADEEIRRELEALGYIQ